MFIGTSSMPNPEASESGVVMRLIMEFQKSNVQWRKCLLFTSVFENFLKHDKLLIRAEVYQFLSTVYFQFSPQDRHWP